MHEYLQLVTHTPNWCWIISFKYWIASGYSTFILISNRYRKQVKSWVNVDYWDRLGHVKETSELHYGKGISLSCTRLRQMTNTSFLVWVCVRKTVHSLKAASQQRRFLLRLVKFTCVITLAPCLSVCSYPASLFVNKNTMRSGATIFHPTPAYFSVILYFPHFSYFAKQVSWNKPNKDTTTRSLSSKQSSEF